MPEQNQQRWIKTQFLIQSLPEKQYLLYTANGEQRLVVAETSLDYINLCDTFRNLPDHAEHIIKHMPKTSGRVMPEKQDIINALITLVDAGLLIPLDALVTEVRQQVTQPTDVATTIGIRTCDRPDNLQRLFHSLLKNETNHSSHYHYQIIEDSSDPAAIAENVETVRQYQAEGMDIDYRSLDQQTTFINELEEQHPEHRSAIEFLFGWRYGPETSHAGRPTNHLVAHNTGQNLILCDDDMEANPRTIPGADFSAVALHSNHRLNWLPKNQAEATAFLQTVSLDPVATHLRALGKNSYQFLQAQLGDSADFAGALGSIPSDNLQQLSKNSQIKITSNGTAGDPGTSSNQWLLTLTGDSRARFVENNDTFNQALTNRLIIACHKNQVLSSSPWCMPTTMMGFDLSTVTSAFLPFGRGSDDLYGFVNKVLYPDGHTLHQPWTLDHYPTPLRHWEPDTVTSLASSGITPLLVQKTTEIQSRLLSDSPMLRMTEIANAFLDMSEASDKMLSEEIIHYQHRFLSKSILNYEKLLQTHPQGPDYWKNTVITLLNSTGRQLMQISEKDHVTLTAGIPGDQPALQKIREILKIWGLSLTFWPKLWQ